MNAPLLQARDVGRSYGTGSRAVAVLRGVSLVVEPGELVALSSRSGSGKSTLCHLVAGIGRPSSGTVEVRGRPAHTVDDWAVVSLLPQRLGLAEELTVAENVLLPARLRAASPSGDDLLAGLGLAGLRDRPAGQTSLGEQQRTALARALVLRPALTVLDEPTGHQDDDHVQLVLARVRAAAADGTAVVVATHDERVLAVADRVVAMRAGQVVPA